MRYALAQAISEYAIPMRLFGVSAIGNEADIVEASLRHNLTLLDGLRIVDHASVDGTSAILSRLVGEGLPLRVRRDEGAGFFQAEWLTEMAREAFVRNEADFVFPIDADEFIKARSRAELEAGLCRVPPDVHAAIRWLTYIPETLELRGRAFGPSFLRWRLKEERHGTGKCIIGRSFALHPRQYVVTGNHLVDDLDRPTPPPCVRIPQDVVALAHCPVRSAEQLKRKVILAYRAHLATRPTNDQQMFHWRELVRDFEGATELTAARLREIACNYSVPQTKWRPADTVELVDDPVGLCS